MTCTSKFIYRNMIGSQQVPGMVVLHCGNAYLITFKVGPLCARTHAHTLAPSILSLLEALA
jgi:hypothetical protein